MNRLKRISGYVAGTAAALFIPMTAAVIITCIVVNPDVSMNAANKALSVCATSIIPALLPFFVLSRVIVGSGFAELIGYCLRPFTVFLFNTSGESSVPILLGYTAGYPTGAYTTCELYRTNLIDKKEAERLLGFTNNSGPLFITGVICCSLLKNPSSGLPLLTIHIVSSIITGIITSLPSRIKKNKTRKHLNQEKENIKKIISRMSIKAKKNIWGLITEAFTTSTVSIISVCGFVVFFSVLSALIPIYFPLDNLNAGILTGIIEITNGLTILSSSLSSSADTIHFLPIISAITAFGGLSVYIQVASVCTACNLNMKGYFTGKCIHCLLAYAITQLCIPTL